MTTHSSRPPTGLPASSPRWDIWNMSIFSGNTITEKRLLSDSGRPRVWGTQVHLRAEEKGPYREMAEGLPALDCNSPDLSSSGSSSSSRAGMWGCLMFSGLVVVRALVSSGRSPPYCYRGAGSMK